MPCNNNRWFEDRNPARAESAVTVISKGDEGHVYSYRWTGYFIPPQTGKYYFKTASDDSSRLFIKKNGSYVQVVNNGGWHGRVTREGNIDLTAGTAYPIYIVFGEYHGGASMDVWWYGGPQSSWSNSLQNYFYVINIIA